MTDRWSLTKKKRLKKLIKATSCGRAVTLVRNCAEFFSWKPSGSCSGL
jgi:hypothetical protein